MRNGFIEGYCRVFLGCLQASGGAGSICSQHIEKPPVLARSGGGSDGNDFGGVVGADGWSCG